MSIEIQKAIIFATLKHQGQNRKGTDIPYIVHPVECMQILTELRCSQAVIIAGLLHDTLEDTATLPQEIEEAFGTEILSIVQNESEDKSKTWRQRKEATIEHLRTATAEVKLVCLADKLSNIRSMYRDYCSLGEKLWQRFNAPKNDLGWYYNSLAVALNSLQSDSPCDFQALQKALEEYKTLVNKLFP